MTFMHRKSQYSPSMKNPTSCALSTLQLLHLPKHPFSLCKPVQTHFYLTSLMYHGKSMMGVIYFRKSHIILKILIVPNYFLGTQNHIPLNNH